MSETAQGPGWWQASNDKWYPPEDHPNYRPPPPAAPDQRPAPPRPDASSQANVGGAGQPAVAAARARYSFDFNRLSQGDRIVGVSTFVLFVALFLPWASYGWIWGGVSALGLDGWMYIVFLLCLGVLAYLVVRGFMGDQLRLPVPHGQLLIGVSALMLFLTVIAFLTIPALPHWNLGAFLGLAAAVTALVASVNANAKERHAAVVQSAQHAGSRSAQPFAGAGGIPPGTTLGPVGTTPGAKSKVAAILLAVFLGPWTWLYTYKRDAKKFWIGLIISGAWLIFWVLAITALTTACTSYYGTTCLSTGVSTGLGLAGVADILAAVAFPGLWIWAIVDSAMKPDAFYAFYPGYGIVEPAEPASASSSYSYSSSAADSESGAVSVPLASSWGQVMCRACGAGNPSGSRFCRACGAVIG